MNKKEIKKLASNTNHIPGIFNYCDRWCERCSFTLRCLNYKISEKQFEDVENKDFDNKKFWNKLSDVFKETIELLEDYSKELGINLNEIDLNKYESDLKKFENEIDQHPLIKHSSEYFKIVNNWFKESEQLFVQKQDELIFEAENELPNTSPFDDLLTINNAIEVINWYQYQINVKLKRAFYSRQHEDLTLDAFPKDSDGSAKVALIGIERSIAAWGKLQKLFSHEDKILDILILLSKIRNKAEAEFPNAKLFKRVGFDD